MNNKKSLPIETSDTLNASRNGKEKWSIRDFDVTTSPEFTWEGFVSALLV